MNDERRDVSTMADSAPLAEAVRRVGIKAFFCGAGGGRPADLYRGAAAMAGVVGRGAGHGLTACP